MCWWWSFSSIRKRGKHFPDRRGNRKHHHDEGRWHRRPDNSHSSGKRPPLPGCSVGGLDGNTFGLTHFSSGVTGDQQGSVRGDSGDHRGDEEEQEPSSLWEGAIRRFHLQQLGPREHDPPGPEHQPALQSPSSRRGLRCCESVVPHVKRTKNVFHCEFKLP